MSSQLMPSRMSAPPVPPIQPVLVDLTESCDGPKTVPPPLKKAKRSAKRAAKRAAERLGKFDQEKQENANKQFKQAKSVAKTIGKKQPDPKQVSQSQLNQPTVNRPDFQNGKKLEIEFPEKDDVEEVSGGQSRLFIGGLPSGVTSNQIRHIFESYGEVKDVFIPTGKTFAFIKMDSRAAADSAKSALRGAKIKGQPRPMRIKFANQGTTIEIKNLSPLISNERLYDAFARFGQIERAVVLVDEKGKSLERGLVEFDRKSSASRAVEQVNNGCYFMTRAPRAVVCCPVEAEDADDGLQEETLYQARAFEREYNHPPRFAAPDTYEMDFGNRWKALEELERSQLEQVKMESAERKRRLEQEMEVGMTEEHERMLRMEMERQRNELERMEEQRQARQNALRTRFETEQERQNKFRASMHDQHKRLRELVEGNAMKKPGEYKPPPTWAPQGFGEWNDDKYNERDEYGSSMDIDRLRRRSAPVRDGGWAQHDEHYNGFNSSRNDTDRRQMEPPLFNSTPVNYAMDDVSKFGQANFNRGGNRDQAMPGRSGITRRPY